MTREQRKSMQQIQRGFYFGDSTFFKMQSIDYFGDIVAGDDGPVVCIKLSKKCFERIPYFERHIIMKQHAQLIRPM